MLFLLRRCVKYIIITAILAAIILVSTWNYLNPSPEKQRIFINGTILTMNANNDIAEAMLIEKDRITSIGSTEEIRAKSNLSAVVVDLQGKTLMPGFIEAHGHFPDSGLDAIAADLNISPIGPVKSISDVRKLLIEQVQKTPKDNWTIGFGYDDTKILENRHITREELDSISAEQPIFVMHVSRNISMVNSAGLKRLGISEASPETAEIERNNQGRVTGLLLGRQHSLAWEKALDLSIKRVLSLLQNAVEDYTVQGITTAQSGLTSPKLYSLLVLFVKLGLIPQRLVIWPNIDLAQAILNGDEEKIDNKKVVTRALKLSLDGSSSAYAIYLPLPYAKILRQKISRNKIANNLAPEEIHSIVTQWYSRDWPIAFHAGSTAAMDIAIDIIAHRKKTPSLNNARHIMVYSPITKPAQKDHLEYSQITTPDQLMKMKELEITPSFFPSYIYYWGDLHKDQLQDNAENISPLKSALDHQLKFSIHSDIPTVPVAPFKLVYHAASRKTHNGKTIGESQQISVLDALRATTIDAAWQSFLDADRGSIESGKLADFIIIDENPLEAGENLENITVEQTWIGGVLRYQKLMEK